MNSRELGQTGVAVPEIGLGTWDYHGGVKPLRAGFERGALFVDTAESYGSEPVVGEAIRGRRNEIFLATKVSPEHFHRRDIQKAADEGLRRLRTDYIDLYQLHQPNSGVPIAETLGAIEDLVEAGKVRFIGVSNFSLAQIKQAQQASRKHPIAANQVRYSVVDRTIEGGLLQYCQANHVSIIAYSPLSRGLSRTLDCDPEGVLAEVARAKGKTIAQVALNWCLCKEGVFVIPKGNSVAHVIENCGASGWRLDPVHIRMIDEKIKFNRRSGVQMLLRQLVPHSMSGIALRVIQRLPRRLRRRFS
ncbi:MAG TPA: aldo/keto reductase [Acidobacteriota bacterium]|nr:aldo/keto reductase [Acidobacteriota bacterium]